MQNIENISNLDLFKCLFPLKKILLHNAADAINISKDLLVESITNTHCMKHYQSTQLKLIPKDLPYRFLLRTSNPGVATGYSLHKSSLSNRLVMTTQANLYTLSDVIKTSFIISSDNLEALFRCVCPIYGNRGKKRQKKVVIKYSLLWYLVSAHVCHNHSSH